MRGGYIILDLKGAALTSGKAANVPGSYAAAENPYKKATLVSGLVVGDVEYPDFGDETLNAVYRGGVRTFAHNALDIFMDCPSRERAGWLCDSYFTAQTEYALFGETRVEDAFLQNYRLYQNRGEYPKGALPMRYPSEHHTDRFIPQWTMWYILEVEQCVNQRGHREEAELFRPSI